MIIKSFITICFLPLLQCGAPATSNYQQQSPDQFQNTNSESYPGILTPVANMNTARAAHTATLLKDGRVLICGGFDASNIKDAEVFNPATKTFQKVQDLSVARSGHTATLLPDGTVLIAGGFNGDYLSSTEIFDPVTNTFSAGPAMTTERSGHTATVLNNETILFAGGVGVGWSFLQTAELYHIPTKTFSSTGIMTTARESHTATLLHDGKVQITGGHKGRRSNMEIYSSAEIYSPTTGKFERAGNMNIIRHKHDAVLLKDGRVLITGGSDQRDSEGAYKSAEIYDAVTATFKLINDMNSTRYKHNGTSILLPNGDVLIAGGADNTEVFEVGKMKFSNVPSSFGNKQLFSCATLLPNGKVLITGGYNENIQPSNKGLLFTSKNDK